ncbi:hypothetical protein ACIA5D_15225 [Actinoplanes sp. NPDC051513]
MRRTTPDPAAAAGDEDAANRARAEALSLLDTARYPDIDRLRAILG